LAKIVAIEFDGQAHGDRAWLKPGGRDLIGRRKILIRFGSGQRENAPGLWPPLLNKWTRCREARAGLAKT